LTNTTGHMDRAVPTAAFGGQHDHSRSEREFARARRHSRLVRLLKIGLPILAIVIVIGGVAVTWLARSLPDDVSVASASLDNGRIVMEDPRMSGFDKAGRPYSMIAQRAIQSLDGGGVELEVVKANVAVREGTTADIVARLGHYDQKAQQLRLYEGVSVETTDGMTIKLEDARIDLAAGDMVGQGPVTIDMPNQTITAGSLNVKDGGKLLSFGDGVKMTLLPSAAEGAAPAPAESN
jgi:lipopolysaccharide export system protein LptC